MAGRSARRQSRRQSQRQSKRQSQRQSQRQSRRQTRKQRYGSNKKVKKTRGKGSKKQRGGCGCNAAANVQLRQQTGGFWGGSASYDRNLYIGQRGGGWGASASYDRNLYIGQRGGGWGSHKKKKSPTVLLKFFTKYF